MSIAAKALPLSRPVAPRRHLRPITSAPAAPRVRIQERSQAAASAKRVLVKRAIVGSILVLLSYLSVTVMCNLSIYQISNLKSESRDLATKTQIVQQQVDSLRSPQNLANSARSLGMIVNSNPVFLKVSSGKVLGSAVPASVASSSMVSSNLIANAALIAKSNPTKATQAKISAPVVTKKAATSVKTKKTTSSGVVLPSAGIPASPTR